MIDYTLYSYIKKHHGLTDDDDAYIRIKNSCFTPYMNGMLEENLPDAIAVAKKLLIVYGILALHRLILACNKEEIMLILPRRLSNSFKELLSAFDEFGEQINDTQYLLANIHA